jgi:type IV pilus modification protein PilV
MKLLSSCKGHRSRISRQAGFSLIELMIAMLVLTVGMLGGMLIITVAVASNAQARFDTAAVTLAQSTMDRLIVISNTTAPAAQTTSMTDCDNHLWPMTASTGGAQLTSTGSIDFSQDFTSVPANYKMPYKLCAAGPSTLTGVPQIYDVRWNIQAGPTASTQLVMVGAKPKGQIGNGQTQVKIFALPTTLRALRGN